jgi:AcrR family transcriptional regulator
MTDTLGSRQERKQRTRQSLLDGALELLADRSLAALSLREVTRHAGIVPTAFYRHFDSMADLGIALVEESMLRLRHMVRTARRNLGGDVITKTVATLTDEVLSNTAHYRFLTAERYGGVPAVRSAINTELRLFTAELTVDLARFPGLRDWHTDDLRMTAELMVNSMLAYVMTLLDVDVRRPDQVAEVRATARKQLRLIMLGTTQWRPSTRG